MRGSEVKDLITSGCNTDNDTSRWSITTHRSASAQLTRIHNQKRTPWLLLSPPLSGDLENRRKCVKLNSSYLVIFVSHFKHQPQIVTKSNIKVLSHTVSTTPKIIIQKRKKIRKEKKKEEKHFEHDLGQGHPDFRSRPPWLQIKVPQTDLGEGVAGVVCRQWLSQHAPVTLQNVSHTKINIILKDKLSLILDHSWCEQNDTWADNKPMHISHADGGLTDLRVFNIGEMTSPLLDGQHTPGLQNGPVQRKITQCEWEDEQWDYLQGHKDIYLPVNLSWWHYIHTVH